jgi:hypothetical protein
MSDRDRATISAVYFPAEPMREPEPVPFVMTEQEVVRFLRMQIEDPYSSLRRYRNKGLLKATQIGRFTRYTLPDVMEFLDNLKEANPK